MTWARVLTTLCALVCLLYCCAITTAALPLGHPQDTLSKAKSHHHWEHIVRRRSVSARFDTLYEDDTAHIVNVQEYYRNTLDQGWDEYERDRELYHLLSKLERTTAQGYDSASIQDDDMSDMGIISKPIRGQYIVLFQKGSDNYLLDRTVEILEKANRDSGMKVRATDMTKLRNMGGFTGTLNSKTVGLLSQHPMIAHIEMDVAIKRASTAVKEESDVDTESKCPLWNLDRLDQHENKLDCSYEPVGTGKNVDIVIIDTGVRATHEEFGDRVHYSGFDAVDYLTGTHDKGKDCNGHGTHCAGTAAGKTFGVAKEASIYNLRALNCAGSGAVSGIVIGIDKMIEKAKTSGRPMVISQSLGVKKSVSLNGAIQRATDAGVTMVGAAGNQGAFSCDYSPPSARVGISVGATDKNDEVSMFTNTGECTDIMAPGMLIKSAGNACDTCTRTLSGTSMATPHGAGVAALILSLHPNLTAKQVKETMMKMSTKDAIRLSSAMASRIQGTPNRLLYTKNLKAKNAEDSDQAGIQEWHDRP